MKLKLIAALVISALVIILLVQNKQAVTYRLFFWQISISQIILVPLILIVGFILGFIVAKMRKRRSTKT